MAVDTNYRNTCAPEIGLYILAVDRDAGIVLRHRGISVLGKTTSTERHVSQALAAPRDAITILPAQITREYLFHHGVCPLGVADGKLLVGIVDNATQSRVDTACDDLRRLYDLPVIREQLGEHVFEQRVERIATARDAIDEDLEIDDVVDTDARNLATQPPVIRFVNFLVKEARDRGASDIHIEARNDGGSDIRFRIDGVLVPAPDAPTGMHAAVVSRVKLLASLDIAERRRPQDGRLRARLDTGSLDLRVSTVPTYAGESVVLRLLSSGNAAPDLESLGMPADVFEAVAAASARSHGLILVTGPTGSGKTTTLYATLRRRDLAAEKVVTVEDPVEYQLDGITQVPVNRQAGVTFASALRSLLRQDPDVMMIGEMRDAETAEIAVQAATTGHLVFSTVHTNDAVGATVRLRDLGVPAFLLAATVELVVAQRLVRTLCVNCAVQRAPDPQVVASAVRIGLTATSDVYGVGCDRCNGTGYAGRVGVFELLRVTPPIRAAIAGEASHTEIMALALKDGMKPLISRASDLILKGITTTEEVVRAVA